MSTTEGANTSRHLIAPRALLVLLACAMLAACGGSGSGGTTSTPATPTTPTTPPPSTNCNSGATARDGTRYTDPRGAPNCLAHLFAEVDNLQGSGDIPNNARGVAFIYDFLFDSDDEDDKLQLFNAGGLDGNGNYFLTTANHTRLEGTLHGAEVRRVYNVFSAVLPAGIITRSLSRGGSDTNSFYSGEQVRRAYTAARSDNPLITSTAASSPYQAHRAIYNFSLKWIARSIPTTR